ncbi:hypothetical protein D3C80_1077830 [compost metagenome]
MEMLNWIEISIFLINISPLGTFDSLFLRASELLIREINHAGYNPTKSPSRTAISKKHGSNIDWMDLA